MNIEFEDLEKILHRTYENFKSARQGDHTATYELMTEMINNFQLTLIKNLKEVCILKGGRI